MEKKYFLIAKRDRNSIYAVQSIRRIFSGDGTTTDIIYINVSYGALIPPALDQVLGTLERLLERTPESDSIAYKDLVDGYELVKKLAALSAEHKHRLPVEPKLVRFISKQLGARNWLSSNLCMYVTDKYL